MDFIQNDNELVNELVVYALTKAAYLPEGAQAALRNAATIGTPGDRNVEGAEVLYAHYDLLDNDGKALMANLFAFGSRSGWSAFDTDGRCNKIVGLVLRERGQKSHLPLTTRDDAPDPQVRRREGEVDWRAPAAAPDAAPPDAPPAE